ncbi:MAG: pseudouridine synthase, partial [Roseateles sp.]
TDVEDDQAGGLAVQPVHGVEVHQSGRLAQAGHQGLAGIETARRDGQEVRLVHHQQVLVLEDEPEVPFASRVLHLDEHLLVADKPHFLPVTPGGLYVQQTLLTRLRRTTGLAELSPLHRLDRETAGLVAFSMRPAERAAYQALFRDRAVDKRYECIAPAGPGPWPRLLRHRLVEPEGEDFMQMQVVAGEPNAETWVDQVQVLPGGLARYELRPRTGLKHQLRAQMNALGLPMVGDRIYPVLQPHESSPRFDAPLQLWARELAFRDPVTGAERHFSAVTMAAP